MTNTTYPRADLDGRKWAEDILLSSAYSSHDRTVSSGRPINAHRKKRKFFLPEEKAQFLNRVKTIGVTLAAQEADTWPDVIER